MFGKSGSGGGNRKHKGSEVEKQEARSNPLWSPPWLDREGGRRMEALLGDEPWKVTKRQTVHGLAHDKNTDFRDFPGSPVANTLHFHCRGLRFDPWSGN